MINGKDLESRDFQGHGFRYYVEDGQLWCILDDVCEIVGKYDLTIPVKTVLTYEYGLPCNTDMTTKKDALRLASGSYVEKQFKEFLRGLQLCEEEA